MTFQKKIIIQALLLLSSATYAQNTLSTATNSLRPDSVGKEVMNFLDPGCSGENICWDFSNIEVQNTKAATMLLYDLTDKLLWDENGSLVTYKPSTDSLLISRIETPLYEMNYSQPIVSLMFPFQYGSSISNPFSGTGSYEGKLLLSEHGYNTVTADGSGTLILADEDTLRNVLRVSTTRSAEVTITDKESAAEYGTLQKATDIHEWYARGYRYPVLKCFEERISKDSTLLRTTHYSQRINPTEMALLEDPANEDIRIADSLAHAAANPLRNLSFTNNGNAAIVTYDLATDTHVSMTLADSRAIVYWRSESDESSGTHHEHRVSLTGLLRGQYIIYINAGGAIYSNKVNVK